MRQLVPQHVYVGRFALDCRLEKQGLIQVNIARDIPGGAGERVFDLAHEGQARDGALEVRDLVLIRELDDHRRPLLGFFYFKWRIAARFLAGMPSYSNTRPVAAETSSTE